MDNRTIILEQISKARQLTPGKVYFVLPDNPPPPGGEFNPFPRLIILTEGKKEALLPVEAGRYNLHLQTGDMLYCLPGTWEKQDWRGRYGMLCIVPRHDFLRVSFYQHSDRNDGRRPAPLAFMHTGLPYCETMRGTVGALNSASGLSDVSVVHDLAKALLGLAELECRRTITNRGGRPEKLFNRIRNWTANSFQEDINRGLVAKVFNVSAGYVSQLFTDFCGCTFQDYLTQCRMDHARELLKKTDLTVYQVADQCGFRNYVHFVRRFRELNGIPPGKYREVSND